VTPAIEMQIRERDGDSATIINGLFHPTQNDLQQWFERVRSLTDSSGGRLTDPLSHAQ